ncbi:Hypothetical predicted protein [Cloeon dipterum]|uniref:Uncharacterized protein n=1 Tax=Cloeon dipterum TaxID=197152 RepID=A0A8S1CRR8_9INSE|nr:Hypothetical predicted protein [Cloeon dipterum]
MRKFKLLVAALALLVVVHSVSADWDDWYRERIRWRHCPPHLRLSYAPYCYRNWRYFDNSWFGRGRDRSWWDWNRGDRDRGRN